MRGSGDGERLPNAAEALALDELRSDPVLAGPVSAAEDGGADACDCPSCRAGRTTAQRRVRVLFEWLLIAIVTLACSLLIRTFIAQAFYIPSESMLPTLHVGDRVIVYKAGYRLSGINRGDVVVFRRPDPYYDIDELIKRVVAVGGETFELQDGVVYIDGEPLDEPYLEPDTVTLPKWPIPDCGDIPRSDRCEVPEGKVLVLGDNREGQPGWPVLRARGR